MPFYKATHKNEWFFVELSLQQISEMINPYLSCRSSNPDKIDLAEFELIKSLFEIVDNKILLSTLPKSNKIGESGKTLLEITDDNKVEVHNSAFAIDLPKNVDAYYDGDKRIYFQKFSKCKSLFKDFDVFYQIASRDEKESFFEIDFFEIGELDPDAINPREAAKIARILDNEDINFNDNTFRQKVVDYADKYPKSGVSVTQNNRLKMHEKSDLSSIIKLLEENFYTSELTDTPMQSPNAKPL